MFFGLAIIIIGFVFLLHSVGLLSGNSWDIIWPCLIMLFGLSIVCKRSPKCLEWLKKDIVFKPKRNKGE